MKNILCAGVAAFLAAGCCSLVGGGEVNEWPESVEISAAYDVERSQIYSYSIELVPVQSQGDAVVFHGLVSGQRLDRPVVDYKVVEKHKDDCVTLLNKDGEGYRTKTFEVTVTGEALDEAGGKYSRKMVEELWASQGNEPFDMSDRYMDLPRSEVPRQPLRWKLAQETGERGGEVLPDLGSPGSAGDFAIRIEGDVREWAAISRTDLKLTLSLGDAVVEKDLSPEIFRL